MSSSRMRWSRHTIRTRTRYNIQSCWWQLSVVSLRISFLVPFHLLSAHALAIRQYNNDPSCMRIMSISCRSVPATLKHIVSWSMIFAAHFHFSSAATNHDIIFLLIPLAIVPLVTRGRIITATYRSRAAVACFSFQLSLHCSPSGVRVYRALHRLVTSHIHIK